MNAPIRILYLGPPQAGKRTNLRWILAHGVAGPGAHAERLDIDLGSLGGVPARLELAVVDGPVDPAGVDALVLVLDSSPAALPANRAFCEALARRRPARLPTVVQWNKRNHPEAMPLHELDLRLNPEGWPAFPACAELGQGVLQTLGALVGMVLAQRQHSPQERARCQTLIESLELPEALAAGFAFEAAGAERLLERPPAPVVDEVDMVGAQVGPCQILTKLGEGGMGAVYLAQHQALGKRVVVKTLKPSLAQDPRRVRRFFLEARAAARLDHPHIVAVLDVGTTDGGLSYIVMQHVEGEDLRRRVDACGRLAPEDATRLVLAVARALTALHAAGIVHRDVKCENVIETPGGEVKLIDFGLAKDLRAEANLTRPGALIGTPAYMAPEIGRLPDIDGRVDIYSLGLTYYHLLSGLQPFEGFPIHAVILGRGRLVPPSEVHPGLHPDHERILARMLAWNRDLRYRDAEALVADLEARLAGEPLAGEDPPTPIFDLDVATRFMGRDPRPIPPTIAPEGEAATRRVERPGPAPLPAPTVAPACFGAYRVLGAVEQGRRYVLFQGWDPDGERAVRLRRCDLGVVPGPSALRCVRDAARFEHPRSPRLRDHVVAGGVTVLVSEACAAEPLASCGEDLSPTTLAAVGADVAGVLAALHEQGLLHGSLRAASVGLDPEQRRVLLDLDLAALRLGLAQEHGLNLGGHPDAPPECRSGRRPTPRGDVYGLGLVLQRAIPAHVEAPALRAVCARAAAPRLQGRYPDMAALEDDLRRVSRGEVPRASPWLHRAQLLARAARGLPGWARWAGALLAAALLLAIGVAWQQAQLAEARSRRLEAVFEAEALVQK